MNFINPPTELLQSVAHRTFYSRLVQHEVGYSLYLPPDYEESTKRYPVVYHLHGYGGNESSDICVLEKVYKSRDAITVFANATSSNNGYTDNELPIESMMITELIPHIDAQYRTVATREGRSLSGFSMGGAGAFYYAVQYPELFGSVTAYAGAYHHFYHKNSRTVGAAPEKAAALLEKMMRERYTDPSGILHLLKQNADKIRGHLLITLYIGTADVLFCDNEILHLYLNSLQMPHEYKRIEGAAHELNQIVMPL